MPPMKHMKHKKGESSKQTLIGTWTGFITTTILFLILGAFLFNWAWWIWFPIGGTLIGAISTTINYFTQETKKCPGCGARLESDAQFCRACGTKILAACPHCGWNITNPKSKYCEKCGKPLYESNQISQSATVKDAMRQEEMMVYCPACGTKVTEGTEICPSCGINL